MRVWLSPLFVIVLMGGGVAHAETDLDVTMRMVPEDEPVSDSVVRRIELPDGARGESGAAARQGLDRDAQAPRTAREGVDRAREQGRGLGQSPGESVRPASQPSQASEKGGRPGSEVPASDRSHPDRSGQR